MLEAATIHQLPSDGISDSLYCRSVTQSCKPKIAWRAIAIFNQEDFSLSVLSRSINRPVVTLGAVAIALALGATQWPALQYLRPIGDFYIALLQMCVLPFLLVTIPLAVRSAMVSGTSSEIMRSLVVWLGITIAAVALVGVLVPSAIFHFMPADDRTIAAIGKLVAGSADRVDINFALNAAGAANTKAAVASSLLAVVPTNIFASLASNDSLHVLVFAAIFGIGMVTSERRSGFSAFGALRHVHDVCLI